MTAIANERDEERKPNETVFERIQRHANQAHGITLSRTETRDVAHRLSGIDRRLGGDLLRWQNESKIAELEERVAELEPQPGDGDVWQAIRDHVDKIYRLEHQVDELQQRIWQVEQRK